MKQFYSLKRSVYMLFAACSLLTMHVQAQFNCDGITNMYGVFIRATNPTGVYVAPIAFSNGNIGTTVRSFSVPAYNTMTGSYGAATLAISSATGRMFYLTRDAGAKYFWTHDPVSNTRYRTTTPSSMNNEFYVKLAVGPDNRVYGLATNSTLADSVGSTRVVRFSDCFTGNNCTTIETLGFIPAAEMYNWYQYNGDICFSSNGDLFLFGSHYVRTSSSTGYYDQSRVYRIPAANIPTTAGTGDIHVDYIGTVPALQGRGVSGAAFDSYGNFYISSADQNAGTSSLYMGSTFESTILVNQITTMSAPASGYFLTDLATCVYPHMVILDEPKLTLYARKQKNSVNISFHVSDQQRVKEYVIEKKSPHYREFINWKKVAVSGTTEYTVADNEELAEGNTHYRVRTITKEGRAYYSATVYVQEHGAGTTFTLKSAVIGQTIEGELYAEKSGMVELELMDHSGRRVAFERKQVQQGTRTIVMEKLPALRSGMYILRINGNKYTQSFKLVKY